MSHLTKVVWVVKELLEAFVIKYKPARIRGSVFELRRVRSRRR